jgi:acyl-CoA synthetase (NDP forming)
MADGRPTSLAPLLHAQSIAIIGASESATSINGRPLRFLEQHGYSGRVYPVNPTRDTVLGHRCYHAIGEVPEAVDVALVMVRAELVPGVLRECADTGTRFAVVVSSGFGEGQGAGAELIEQTRALLKDTEMRVLGPNCQGLHALHENLSVTFTPVADVGHTGRPLKPGGISVVSQSGGLGFAVAQWGLTVGLGFSHIVTTGNELDLKATEIARTLVEESETTTLVLIFEQIADADLDEIVTRATALGKTVVAAKLGRTPAGIRGALSHTLHDAGPLQAAPPARPGLIWVDDAQELNDTLLALSGGVPLRGDRVGIACTSGGSGIWLADAVERAGLSVPELTPATQARMAPLMPGYGSPRNPVDMTAQFLFVGGTFGGAVDALFASEEVDAVVIATSLAAPGRLEADKPELADVMARHGKPLLVYTYTEPAESCVRVLTELGVPWYTSSTRVARALQVLAAVPSLGRQLARTGAEA